MSGRLPVNGRKIAVFLAALFLFILAIQLLKSGARVLAPFIQGGLKVDTPANAVGFGWLFAYLVLSGSPVAATSLAFLDAGVLDRAGAFGMIAGSRLGASFIVLAIGVLYSLRGHDRARSLAMGLLSFVTTASTQAPALLLGLWLLQQRALDWAPAPAAGGAASALDLIYDPILGAAEAWLPRWGVFLAGFGVLWYSLNLIDHALPDMHLKESAFSGMARVLYQPAATFALGLAITSLTMSVSVSLSVLVPLSARGFIRRENVIPYIMGANITTFIDTLAAAILLGNPQAFTVVLAEMISAAAVSLAILALAYRPYERLLLAAVEYIGRTRRSLAVFVLMIIGIPVMLLLWP